MNRIITISREFGSGGREAGKRLADALHCAYYDSEIEASIAQNMDLDESYIARSVENGVLANIPLHFGRTIASTRLYKQQVDILVEKRKVLCQIAAASDCVIVGRAADVILAEQNPLKLFVYASMEQSWPAASATRRPAPPAPKLWKRRSGRWTPAAPAITGCFPPSNGATGQTTTCASTPPGWRSSS